ncbi:MAG: hypothetical protein CBE47_04260 [Pelagibacteraceae bacterium TMED287]|nr:MAG: hypothetical protein CBE47_04260 [Pelagibacteraceae bacterium TMED287]|tara:strand:- start:949 stop:1842 length:894 start_codon:yes stop_codon:yes gene_type:complete
MKKYIIFRTDRIGDFLLSAILIKSIKRNEQKAHITVVASEKNYDYIKSYRLVDKVYLLKKGFFEKTALIKSLKQDSYKAIIIHDSKKRSMFISFFLKTEVKIISNSNSNISYFSDIHNILNQLNFKYDKSDLNTLPESNYNDLSHVTKNYILFHFDEKWIHGKYISNYINIEPSESQLTAFLNLVADKTNKNIIVTTGLNPPDILNKVSSNNFNNKVTFLKNLNFLQLENIVKSSDLLISCHGAISHVATAKNIRQIDIIDESKTLFYKKWTHHFRNYKSIYRKEFDFLSKSILRLL